MRLQFAARLAWSCGWWWWFDWPVEFASFLSFRFRASARRTSSPATKPPPTPDMTSRTETTAGAYSTVDTNADALGDRHRPGGQLPSASDLTPSKPATDKGKSLIDSLPVPPVVVPLDVPPIVILPIVVPVAVPTEDPEADVGLVDAIARRVAARESESDDQEAGIVHWRSGHEKEADEIQAEQAHEKVSRRWHGASATANRST